MQNNSEPRTGDRLWYEEETGGLTPPQLEAVKQVSLEITHYLHYLNYLHNLSILIYLCTR